MYLQFQVILAVKGGKHNLLSHFALQVKSQ